ncbi:MAG: YggS family pyridoxal phosphate-dependent enzyme [Treponemataceae bacterium]|nr:YggS family pyridoxal phosphate-dependent enzyme [Treponemataceae bacterium]
MTGTISERIEKVQENIENAAVKCGRNSSEIKLMAVSKFHSAEEIEQSYECGLKLFGENRVQEAGEKFPKLIETHPDINLHLIGSLQRNKVKQILPIAKCIQSLDRLELAQEIAKRADNLRNESESFKNYSIEVLFEIHTGEESKSGFLDETELLKTIDFILETNQRLNSNLIIPKGFMTMAPFTQDEKLIHSSFEKLRNLRDKIQAQYKMLDLAELSMGMSADYQIAIEEGSTLVRVGTAIFGERIYK